MPKINATVGDRHMACKYTSAIKTSPQLPTREDSGCPSAVKPRYIKYKSDQMYYLMICTILLSRQ